MEAEDAILGILFAILIVCFAGGMVYAIDAEVQYSKFVSVCEYEGGAVEGDVCIKDKNVIFTKKEYENDR